VRAKKLWAVLLGPCLVIAAPAESAGASSGRIIRISIKNQSLAAALLDVAQQAGIELILAVPTAPTMPAPKLHGRYTLEEALSMLIEGSGLVYRRSGDGAYVVSTRARAPTEEVAPAMPDILVIGRRTQNTDIRRGENDIQPYQVWTSEDVERSHSSDVDDFLRNRVTSNARMGSAAQMATGDGASQVDLRGLGQNQTLVLVDGRRMPPEAAVNVQVFQTDINGIPLSAIERVEVLNSTAGGIYGPGATAGVINIVLKRNYHGADIGMTYGLSDRGDAATKRIDARIGFSSESGGTQLMVAASRTWGGDLRAGDRTFTARARERQRHQDPVGFAARPPVSRSVNVVSADGKDLTFDPAYGGGTLGAASTSVPATYGGVAADGGTLYSANAGGLDASLSPDVGGADRSLLTRPQLASLLANARHSFGDALEAYVDLIAIENAGQAMIPHDLQTVSVRADAPTNPFQQDILVSFPLPGYAGLERYRYRTARLTGGLIVALPHTWKANADYSVARATNTYSGTGVTLDGLSRAAFDGTRASGATYPVNPLAGQTTFLASIRPLELGFGIHATRRTDFGDFTLRLAGPIVELAGGPLELSVLFEDRYEKVQADTVQIMDVPDQPVPGFGTRTRSAYAEIRAPLLDRVTGPAGLRGLEFQLAVRHDANRSSLPEDLADPSGTVQRFTASATTYTAGLRFFPVDGVMLRGSIASGFLPPTAAQMGSLGYSYTSSATALANSPLSNVYLVEPNGSQVTADPLRGGTNVGSDSVVSLSVGGSPNLKSERAQSLSAGIVLTPLAIDKLRLSIDYTRIDKSSEIVDFHSGDQTYFLLHETEFPTRVIRAQLTDADRAKGYAAGVVTAIDTSSFNIGRTVVEALDIQLDYRIPSDTVGDFRIHGSATWQPLLARRDTSGSRTLNSVGYTGGPLEWRANGGVDWQSGSTDLGIVATYFDSYRVARSGDSAATAAQAAALQGARRIPSQIYFDLYASRHIVLPNALAGVTSADVRFGVQNILDHRPPIIVDPRTANYSLYGDPRLRRFELTIIGRF
jgi:outer membrane receptor protein involved in Fe transport